MVTLALALIVASSTPLVAADEWWRERAQAEEREQYERELGNARAPEPSIDVAIGAMIGAGSGGALGGVVTYASFIGAFATGSFPLLIGAFVAFPVLVIAGATLGAWLAGDDEHDAFAGTVGGVVGLVVGAVAAGVGVTVPVALPIPAEARPLAAGALVIGGVITGVAASGAAAYGAQWVRARLQ